jgi:non-specific serine/threonine protein kinase
MIGKTISHYKILEKLGQGGMGVIYKAQDLKLDRFVALKFLPQHLTTSEEEKQRFIHEAKAASTLEHNNICNIHEIDETEDGQLFISMAYYEGETLDKRIKEKPLAIDEAVDIAIQIAQGLAKAHEKNIVHRDIKPANIMLTEEGVVKVLDFGLAKLSTQTKLTKESTTLGTVSYMSSEQAKGEDVDYRTDIWSLGVIIYEMLTGQLPFKGEYESAVIYSIMNDTQEQVTGLRTGVPMELERIINKCLQKSPAERYQHVDELIVDMQGVRRQTESTITPTVKEPPKKYSKYVIISVAVLSFLIIIVAGYFLIDRVTHTEEPETRINTLSQWENSIAVLPFDDLSPEGDQEWFCEGMTEQIITNLARLPQLKVISRTSVMKYKETEKSLPQIGKELNVSYVLEGSVRKFGNRIRVTTQLIGTEDDFHKWTETFDRKYKEIFDIQDDISEKIATALLTTLSPEEQKEIKTNRPNISEAYEYYMRGKHVHFYEYYESDERKDFLRSEEMFKKAINLDPNFAASFASLADLYNTYYNGLPDTSNEKDKYMRLQEAYLDTAYQLDPNSAEVYNAKGWIHTSKSEIDQAFISFKKAIQLNPNNDLYYQSMGVFYRSRRCYKLSIRCFDKAIEINPLDAENYSWRGYYYLHLMDHQNAEKDFNKAIEIDSSQYFNRRYWWLLVFKEQYEEAKKQLKQAKIKYPNRTHDFCEAFHYLIDGEKEIALNTLKSDYWFYRMIIYSLLEMEEQAINVLQNEFEEHKRNEEGHYWLRNLPYFQNLLPNPRFQEILAKHKELYEENLEKYGDIDI